MIAYNQIMKDKHKNWLFYSVIGLILLAGIVLRVLFFSFGRPFWNDESAMALNLLDRGFLALFAPLDYNQLTPPLYSVACKFCSLLVHKAEYAYRLPALICSVASPVVFYVFSKKVLQNRLAVVFAVSVFALNYHIIYYAQELKQYSCDVLLFLMILMSYFLIRTAPLLPAPQAESSRYSDENMPQAVDCVKRCDTAVLVLISVFYAVSMWFSYTALFAMFVVFLTILARPFLSCVGRASESFKNRFNNHTWSADYIKYAVKPAVVLFALPLASFCLLCLNVTRFAKDTELHAFWADGFVAKNLSNLPHLVYNNMVFYFPDLGAKILLVVLFAAGVWLALKSIFHCFAQKEPQLDSTDDVAFMTEFTAGAAGLFMLVLSVALAFVMAYFNIYPMYLRTALYLFPVVVLIMACTFEYCFFQKNKAGGALCILCTVLFVFVSCKTVEYQILRKEYYRESTPQILELFKQNAEPDAKLIVPSLSSINYEYYSRFAGINSKNVYFIKYPLYEYADIKTAYDTLTLGVYYVIVTHSGDKAYELKNLEKYASSQKEYSVVSDKFDNALIRFRK